MRPAATLTLVVLLACSRGSGAVPSPTQSAAPSPSATPPAASAQPVATPCTLAAGYRGTVDGQRVFARLGRDGSRLHGRYFYERAGIDLRLEGWITDANAVQLTEGDEGSHTGRFAGTCDDASGAIDGTWTGAKASGPFHLEPIAPGEVALAAVKHFAVSRPVPGADPQAMLKDCTYTESRVELFGLRDASVEQKINGQGLEPFVGPRLELDLAREASHCGGQLDRGDGSGFEADAEQTLVDSFRELATLQTSGSIDSVGAHPGELPFSLVTIDLRTGLRVTPKDVFARNPLAHVLECAARAKPFDAELEVDEWKAHMDAASFDLTDTGMHFFGQDFPHVMAVLDGAGPVIGYDVLLRDGYLRTDSPVQRAWAGVKPAPKGKDWCPEKSWQSWWQ